MDIINIVSLKIEIDKVIERKHIDSQYAVANFATELIGKKDREYLIVICLDTKNKINNVSTVSMGSLNSSVVHPREVFKTAILSNSASIILAHNHPSGDLNPSKEDINITDRLKEAGKILGIQLLDHVIVNDDYKFFSFKEKWLI